MVSRKITGNAASVTINGENVTPSGSCRRQKSSQPAVVRRWVSIERLAGFD
jgi:hypothetical protein